MGFSFESRRQMKSHLLVQKGSSPAQRSDARAWPGDRHHDAARVAYGGPIREGLWAMDLVSFGAPQGVHCLLEGARFRWVVGFKGHHEGKPPFCGIPYFDTLFGYFAVLEHSSSSSEAFGLLCSSLCHLDTGRESHLLAMCRPFCWEGSPESGHRF